MLKLKGKESGFDYYLDPKRIVFMEVRDLKGGTWIHIDNPHGTYNTLHVEEKVGKILAACANENLNKQT